MQIPKEFEAVLQGVELTESEIKTLCWIAGWEQKTINNLQSIIKKARGKGGTA